MNFIRLAEPIESIAIEVISKDNNTHEKKTGELDLVSELSSARQANIRIEH